MNKLVTLSTGLRAVMGVVLLVICNAGQASDCSPGSPIYEDRFFRYCDEARAANEGAAPVRSGATEEAKAHSNQRVPADVPSRTTEVPAVKGAKID